MKSIIFCFLVLSIYLSFVLGIKEVQCPDKSVCMNRQTCCALERGGYGCCPYESATCCSDKEHCCPNGYECDLVRLVCVGAFFKTPYTSGYNNLKYYSFERTKLMSKVVPAEVQTQSPVNELKYLAVSSSEDNFLLRVIGKFLDVKGLSAFHKLIYDNEYSNLIRLIESFNDGLSDVIEELNREETETTDESTKSQIEIVKNYISKAQNDPDYFDKFQEKILAHQSELIISLLSLYNAINNENVDTAGEIVAQIFDLVNPETTGVSSKISSLAKPVIKCENKAKEYLTNSVKLVKSIKFGNIIQTLVRIVKEFINLVIYCVTE